MKAVPRVLIQAMSLIQRVMWCCPVLPFFMMQTPFVSLGAAHESRPAVLNWLTRKRDLRRPRFSNVSGCRPTRRRPVVEFEPARTPQAGGERPHRSYTVGCPGIFQL